MKKSKFSETQIVSILKQGDAFLRSSGAVIYATCSVG
jgi:16S rRNA C967 or C1407 C5-methylase (RsmB/RsmF family)